METGFVVVAIEPSSPSWNTSMRRKAMLCTLFWLESMNPPGWDEAGNNRLNCDVVAMGHSVGGGAAFRVIETFPVLSQFPDLPAWDLRAAVAIAPFSVLEGEENGTFPIEAGTAVPYLVVGGANDDDIGSGDAARTYDILAAEEMSPLSAWDKAAVWSYGTPHCAWGGKSDCDATDPQRARARAVSITFIPAFLRWQVFGEVAVNRDLFTDLVRYNSTVDDFPGSLTSVDLMWSEFFPQFMDLGQRPVIIGDLSTGTCGDPGAVLQLDTMHRSEGVLPCDDPDATLSPSTLGKSVSIVGFGDDRVCLGLATDFGGDETHETNVMNVVWGGLDPGGDVIWQVDESLVDFDHISLRLGQDSILDGMPTTEASVTLQLLLGTEDEGGQELLFPVDLTPILQQDKSTGGIVANLMRTFRIPLTAFSTQGASLSQTRALILRFPGTIDPRSIFVDSIEFVKDFDDIAPACN